MAKISVVTPTNLGDGIKRISKLRNSMLQLIIKLSKSTLKGI